MDYLQNYHSFFSCEITLEITNQNSGSYKSKLMHWLKLKYSHIQSLS